MTMGDKRGTMGCVPILAAAGIWLLAGVSAPPASADPADLLGPEQCSECHGSENAAWEATTHAQSFASMHRSPKAKEIASSLGIRRIKGNDLCQTCHYTTQASSTGRLRAVEGPSCESCHGAAAEWLNLHNDYGGQATRETESPEHKQTRLEKTAQLGMIRPDQPYLVAANCYQCHTVPNERLVNVGGHPAGSSFELVSWLHGEVRHNFFATNGKENRGAPKDLDPDQHKRVLYVVGQMLDLEYSLRAAAQATQGGAYADAMAGRVQGAVERLNAIQGQAAETPLAAAIGRMLKTAGGVTLEPNNRAALLAAADAVKTEAERIVADLSPGVLAALDSLIPGTDGYMGTPHE